MLLKTPFNTCLAAKLWRVKHVIASVSILVQIFFFGSAFYLKIPFPSPFRNMKQAKVICSSPSTNSSSDDISIIATPTRSPSKRSCSSSSTKRTHTPKVLLPKTVHNKSRRILFKTVPPQVYSNLSSVLDFFQKEKKCGLLTSGKSQVIG